MKPILTSIFLLLSTLQVFSIENSGTKLSIEIRDQSCLDPRVPYFYNGKRITITQLHRQLLEQEDAELRAYAEKANTWGGLAEFSSMLFIFPTVAGVIVYGNDRSAGLGLLIAGAALLVTNITAGSVSYTYYHCCPIG